MTMLSEFKTLFIMSDSKVFMFPDGGNTSSIDPNLLMALNNNGGFGGNGNWLWIFFLFFLWPLMRGNNAFATGDAALSNTINNDQGRALLMQAIQGNGNAISQLATTLNCDSDSIRSAINSVMSSVQSVGNQVGLSSTQVINAIQAGNASLGQQLAQCCCNVREAITNQGYENRIATLEQTNILGSKIDAGDAAIAQAIQAQTTVINDKFCDLEKRELQNRITELIETRNTLQGQISNANQTAAIQSYIANVVNPIAQEVTAIKQSLPSTVSVQYPQLTVIPNYYYSQNSIWG